MYVYILLMQNKYHVYMYVNIDKICLQVLDIIQ